MGAQTEGTEVVEIKGGEGQTVKKKAGHEERERELRFYILSRSIFFLTIVTLCGGEFGELQRAFSRFFYIGHIPHTFLSQSANSRKTAVA